MAEKERRARSTGPYLLGSVVLTGALIAGVSGCIASAQGALRTVRSARVTVRAAGASVPSTALGVNTAVWDPFLTDPAIPGVLQRVHTEILRYPGGSTSDTYHWQDNSTNPNVAGLPEASNSFDNFMTQVAGPAHAAVMITVNYGSNAAGTGGGDPQEAAAWVKYANVTRGYGVKYWEIGNEIYGNGYYGAHWETDLHSDHSPAAYADNALTFIHAMKAADPTIQVGLVLVPPGAWPEGRGPQDWNRTVLARACDAADFVSIHWYAQNPGHESDPGLLASVRAIPRAMRALRAQMVRACGTRGAQMPVMLTETNSVSSSPGKQTLSPINGLFLIEDYLQWLSAGVQNVSWWTLHNGTTNGNDSRKLIGKSNVGDYGLLAYSNAPSPYTSYTALRLVAPLLVPGSILLPVKSTRGVIHAYAVKSPDGTVTVVAVNAGAKGKYRLAIHLAGSAAPVKATVTTYGVTSPHPATKHVSLRHGYTLPPYAAAFLHLGS